MVPFDATLLLSLLICLPAVSALALLFWAVVKVEKKCGRLPPDFRGWMERKGVVLPAAAVLVLYALAAGYGYFIEAHWVEETHTEVRVDRPVLGYEKFRIVHLSDLHLIRLNGRDRDVLERARAAQPHLILLTGDYMNAREGGPALVEFLQGLQAPYGVFAVPGTWDLKFVTRRLFEAAGVELLEDDTRLIRQGAHRLRIVGQSVYPTLRLRELLEGIDDDAYTIYLHHKPEGIDELRVRDPAQRVDLFLCGHTHGGQIRLPFWGAVIPAPKVQRTYQAGLYAAHGVTMYVNRGVGTSGLPLRFLARPEVAVIDLVYR